MDSGLHPVTILSLMVIHYVSLNKYFVLSFICVNERSDSLEVSKNEICVGLDLTFCSSTTVFALRLCIINTDMK